MRYNGWANFATWKVQLELFSDFEVEEAFPDWEEMDMRKRAESIEEYVKFFVYASSISGTSREFAMGFIEEVDWVELAECM